MAMVTCVTATKGRGFAMLDYLSNEYCAVRPGAGDRLAFILTLSVGVMRTGGGRASEPNG